MFSQACVKNSVHKEVCIPACTGADTPHGQVSQHALGQPPKQVSQHALGQTYPRQTPPWADTPQTDTPHRSPLQQTVRILLECILVHFCPQSAVWFLRKRNVTKNFQSYDLSQCNCSMYPYSSSPKVCYITSMY